MKLWLLCGSEGQIQGFIHIKVIPTSKELFPYSKLSFFSNLFLLTIIKCLMYTKYNVLAYNVKISEAENKY